MAGTVQGLVLDRDGNPLANVAVTSGDKSATTDAQGKYTIAVGTAAERVVLTLVAEGFFRQTVGVRISALASTNLKTMLLPREKVGTVDAALGGFIQSAKMGAAFQPDSFIVSSSKKKPERVNVFAAYADPDDPSFGFIMPGGDFRASAPEVDRDGGPAEGSEGVLSSFGALVVEAEDDDGNAVELSNLSEFCIDIPSSMIGSAPSTMPIWVLGTSTAEWDQTTIGVRQGDQYCFEAEILGSYNCDIFSRVAVVTGKLCDERGAPLADTEISIRNQQVGSTQIRFMTDAVGKYSVAVGAGIDFSLEVESTGDSQSVCALCPDETKTVNLGSCPPDGTDAGFDPFESCFDNACYDDSAFTAAANAPVCNDQQVAGADEPETRVLELGRRQGTFQFTFNMQTQKDRMEVLYAGQVIYDTGCISDGTTVSLDYAGTTTSVTVRVTPNCEGGTGTAWDFSVSCPRLLPGSPGVDGGGIPQLDGGIPQLDAGSAMFDGGFDAAIAQDGSVAGLPADCAAYAALAAANPTTSACSASWESTCDGYTSLGCGSEFLATAPCLATDGACIAADAVLYDSCPQSAALTACSGP